MSERQIKLSLEKFTGLLHCHKYILTAVYCEGSDIKFVECRSPKLQKTFVVYLPSKYTMPLSSKSSLKRLGITSIESPPSSRQIQFMSDMKGPLLECDLLAVSSEMLCIFRNSGDAGCYLIEDEESKNDEGETPEVEDEKTDKITHLERETVKVLQKVKPGAKLPKVVLRERSETLKELEEENEGNPPEGNEEETESSLSEPEDNGSVELVFEDEDGEPLDEVKHMLTTTEKSLRDIKEKVSQRDAENDDSDAEDSDEEEKCISRDNSLPPDLEDGDVVLGIIYVMIDIGSFFKKITLYEEEIIKCYEQLDDNELDIRNEKLAKLREVSAKFLDHADERLKKINEEEKALKLQLIRLTVVLAQAEALKSRIEKKPDKYGEIVPESELIYNQTRKTIYELNMELLRLRDESDELLSNYQSSIDELIEL